MGRCARSFEFGDSPDTDGMNQVHDFSSANEIDMPIDMNETAKRRSDIEARRELKLGRAIGVFPPLCRGILHIAQYEDVVSQSRTLVVSLTEHLPKDHRKGQQTMQPPNNVNTNMNNMVVNIGSIPVASRNQRPWITRAIYFLLIGWWFSLIWILLAWLLAVTVVGLPAAQSMFLRVNAVLTLQRLN